MPNKGDVRADGLIFYDGQWRSKEGIARRLAGYRKYYAANRNKRQCDQRTRRYGLDDEDWNTLFEAQGRVCRICGSAEPRSKKGWSTDHHHGTNRVRAILCNPCNAAIGLLQENPVLLRAAADYLERTVPELMRAKMARGAK